MLADPEEAAVFKLLRTGPAAEKEFTGRSLCGVPNMMPF
jgi:hypothetical protein